MSWIKTIDYNEADEKLRKIYDRVKGPDNNVDNVLLIHSLRPHTLTGHMGLYKNVLHHRNNSLPKWYLESLGVFVSYLNQCNYCVEHHASGLERLINDQDRFNVLLESLKGGRLQDFFEDKLIEGLEYACMLTLEHTNIKKENIESLKKVGFSEGEVLEINQLVSYFNYVNRTVVGLGVNTQGDILGLSPNDNEDPNNWQHG